MEREMLSNTGKTGAIGQILAAFDSGLYEANDWPTRYSSELSASRFPHRIAVGRIQGGRLRYQILYGNNGKKLFPAG